MKHYIFDIETNGLEYSKIHCISLMLLQEDRATGFGPKDIDLAIGVLQNATVLIGHNIISFDIPAIHTILGVDLRGKLLIDTAIMSRALYPDRPSPKGSPKSLLFKPHSMEAWGYRLGQNKMEHEDWEEYSEEMLRRCNTDVELNKKIYGVLLKEGKLTHEQLVKELMEVSCLEL